MNPFYVPELNASCPQSPMHCLHDTEIEVKETQISLISEELFPNRKNDRNKIYF